MSGLRTVGYLNITNTVHIIYDDLTDLNVVRNVSVNDVRYRDEVIAPDVIALESSMSIFSRQPLDARTNQKRSGS